MNTPDILSFDIYRNCSLRPRICKTDRGLATGFCGCGDVLTAARAALHHWGEPCINRASTSGDSDAIFLPGYTPGYCSYQNHQISNRHFGREMTAKELDQAFLRFRDQGAYNINLVASTRYLSHIISVLDQVCFKLTMPVVYNCGGYKRVEMVKALKDYVDIWLPGFKYYDNRLAWRHSRAKDYFETATAAIRQMIGQIGAPVYQFASPGLLAKGVIIRHVVLPGQRHDSIALLEWINGSLPYGRYMINLMGQYAPYIRSWEFPELDRRITSYECGKMVDAAIHLGLTQDFMQEKSSAREEYTPPFDLEGL